MRRGMMLAVAVPLVILAGAGPALACGGLIGANGTVNLVRTSTLAAYHDGVEHYVTSFEFAGGGARFGSIVPLPGVPKRIIKGGDWTLQRLGLEVQPPVFRAANAGFLAAADAEKAVVVKEVQIDALNITILKGGGFSVGQWAEDNGFQLPPDAPEVLDFYASRSPIFMAARFDAKEARERGFGLGDGTPVHLAIPTEDPWVPLRILALGKQSSEVIEADVFLLTDNEPTLLPRPLAPGTDTGTRGGVFLERSEPASDLLLSDLRSDKRMKWLPASDMWLTYLRIDAEAGALYHDLAVDETGLGSPSAVDAGLELPPALLPIPEEAATAAWMWVLAAAMGVGGILLGDRFASSRS